QGAGCGISILGHIRRAAASTTRSRMETPRQSRFRSGRQRSTERRAGDSAPRTTTQSDTTSHCVGSSRHNEVAMRLRAILFMVGIAVVAGCGEIKKWREEAEKWHKQFDELNATIKTTGELMVTAADKIDPLAIKEMFRRIEDLQKMNENLRTTNE